MAEINKKSLEHLADLARLELQENEIDKFLKDLEKILDHFQELQTLNTDGIMPMTGGTPTLKSGQAELNNVFREDGEITSSLKPDLVVEAFPEKDGSAGSPQDGSIGLPAGRQGSPHGKHWLKVPPVFE